MAEWEIDVRIDEGFRDRVEEEEIARVVQEVLSVERVGSGGVSLYITDEATVRQLNHNYRGINEPTDVLSFPLASRDAVSLEAEPGSDFVLPGEIPLPLGEVVISYPQAERQAAEQGHPPQEEMTLLIVHGVLHLLGHDHEQPQDAAIMAIRERELLNKLGLTTGVIDRAGL